MGAEISSDRELQAYRDEQFAEKYRQRYGNSVPGPMSAEDIMEQIKSERIMLEQQRRYDSTLNREEKSKSDDEFYRRRDENYKIMKRSYERNNDDEYYRRRGESDRYRRHRSRRERDDDYRRRRSKSRRHGSSRSRSRSESSSSSGNKENKKSSYRRSRSKSAKDGRERSSRSKSRDGEDSRQKSKKSDRGRFSPERKPKKNSRSKENSVSKSEKDSTSDKNKPRKQKAKKKQSSQVAVYKSTPDLTTSQRQYGIGPWQRAHEYFNNFEQRPQSWVAELSQDAAIPGPIIERQIVYGLPATLPRAVDGMGYPLKQNGAGFQPVPYQTYLMQKPSRARSMEFYGTRAHEPAVLIQPSTHIQSSAVSPVSPSKDSTLAGATSPKIVASNAQSVTQAAPNAVYATVNKNRTKSHQPVIRQTSYEVQAHLRNPPPPRVQRVLSDSSSVLPNYRNPPRYGVSDKKKVTPTPKQRVKTTSREKNAQRQQDEDLNATRKHTANKKKRSKITAQSARQNFEGLLASDYDMMKPHSTGEFSEEFPSTFPATYKANQEIFVDDVVFRQHPRIRSISDSDSSEMVTDEEHALTLGEEFSPTSFDSSGNELDIPEGYKFDVEEANLRKNRKTQTVTPKSAVLLTSAQKRKKKEAENKMLTSAKSKNENSTKGTQTKAKSQQITKPIILSTVEPVARKSKKFKSPERKTAKDEKTVQKEKSPASQRAHRGKSPTRKSKASVNTGPSSSRRHRSSSMEAEREITPVRAPRDFERPKRRADRPVNGVSVLPEPQRKKTKNKKIQHPTKDGSFLREIVPSRNWEREQRSEPKKMLNKSTSTPSNKKQKSVAVQTKSREPTKPLYFLKPISSHEVFIDDTITSPSEASLSSARVSSLVSQSSTIPRSENTSWTKSSGSSEIIDESEVESVVVNNFQRNSKYYSSNRQQENSSEISADSSEHISDQPSLLPPSVKLGVSESIQASSFSRRDGKVFCITRSRCSSSPPPLSLPGNQNHLYTEQEDLLPTNDQQIEPTIDRAIMNSQTQPDHDYRRSAPVAHRDDFQFFNPDDVKLWVLDCYVQDQKMTNREQQMKIEGYRGQSPPELPGNIQYGSDARYRTENAKTEAQHSIIQPPVPSPMEPSSFTVTPLTTKHLLAHEDMENDKKMNSVKKLTASTTDASLDLESDVGAFQREVMKAKHKIWKKRQRQQGPEPADPSEQYKGRLKQWNNSPTSNVVLAECCAVTDVDNQSERRKSAKTKKNDSKKAGSSLTERKHTPEQNERVPFSRKQGFFREQGEPLVERDLKAQNGRVSPKAEQNYWLKSGSQTMDNIDKFLEDLDQGKIQALSVNSQLRQKQEVAPSPGEDWRIVNDRTSAVRREADPAVERDLGKDVNDNHPRMVSKPKEEAYVIPNYQVNIFRRASMDSLLDTTSKNSNRSTKTKDSRLLSERSSSLHSLRNEEVASSPVTNPFTKMVSEDVTPYLGKPTDELYAVGSEKDIMDAFEKAKEKRKSETLEERTARILGIHRKRYSSDEERESEKSESSQRSDGSVEKPSPKKSSSAPRKPSEENRDFSLYMNNLLTGVADVSPATRERFVTSGQRQIEPKNSTASSLRSVENLGRTRDAVRENASNSRNRVDLSRQDSDESSSTDSTTASESFSVNVSDSVLEATVDCEVRRQQDHGAPASPKEYKIPDASGKDIAGLPGEEKGRDVMDNYTMNIYADTPKFHQKQQSFDTTESEDTDLDASFSSKGKNQVHGTMATDSGKADSTRVQDSPVPISSNSAPLTDREIEIVKQLYDENTAGRSSSNSHEGEKRNASDDNVQSFVDGDTTRKQNLGQVGKPPHVKNPDRSSTPSHDDDRDSEQGRGSSPGAVNRSNAGVSNVMESLGLNPEEAWLFSV